MSSASNVSASPGTLIVEVPHWATTVRVFDNLSQAAINVSAPIEVHSGLYCVTSTLSPGVYKVEVALGTTSDNEWVSVRPDKKTTIPVGRWETLHLASAAPLQMRGSGPDPHARAAAEWSRTITWPATQAGAARLFIFVQTPDSTQHPNFAQGLTLLDANGQLLTALESDSVFKDATVGCMAFATDLPGGFYTLCRTGPGPFQYHQPVYLCEGWETHVFIVGGKGPSFRYLTVNMAPHGAGFHYDDETATASEAVLTALVRERGMRAVLGSSELRRLLHKEQKNPWLAVLAAHAIVAAEEEAQASGTGQPNTPNCDPALRDDVITFLTATIGHHPDVQALCLKPDAPAPQPFAFPPMLRMSLRRVQRHATHFADTIPIGSLTDWMLSRQVTGSAWSVWRQPLESPSGLEAVTNAPAGTNARGRRRIASAILRSNFTPNAPIYLPPPASEDAPPGPSDLGRVLYDLPVIRAAQQMIGVNAGPLPDKIVVDPRMELSKLLEDIDARALSAATGIPLGKAERTIEQLLETARAGASIADSAAGPTAQAVVEFALRQSSRTQPPSDSGLEAASNVARPQPETASRTTIEEDAATLRSAAIQLTSAEAPVDGDANDATRAAKLGHRFHALAEALLGHADFVAITGRDGQFLYANGAFTMLLTLSDPKHPHRAGRQWCKWLSTLPAGRTSNATAPIYSSRRVWTVRRSAVEYAGSDGPNGYINILNDERISRLAPDVLDRIRGKVCDVTLHGSFVQYGSPRRRVASIDQLEKIASELERALAGAAGAAGAEGAEGAGSAGGAGGAGGATAERTAMAITREAAMTRFDAPGFLQDWNETAAKKWSEWIAARLDETRAQDGSAFALANYGPRLQFFNPLVTPPAADAVDKDIEWTAFPRIVQLQSISDKQRWRTADSSRDAQDEYCEWSVLRDPVTDKIQRVSFTSEGPEYWEFLAAMAPAKVLELYQKHVSPDVKREDLFRNGRYDARNRWNNSTTAGAMHLIQPNNTLGAEIELAGAATIVRRRSGVPITEAQELIECGQYGAPERHSDPHIGAVVNELARLKADITLKNPIGLYIAGLSVAGWQTPDNSDPLSYWTITRGTKEKTLRAVYEVPAAKGFTVGDITINGKAIEFGAQIADFIRIKLTGTATRIGQRTVAPFDACVSRTADADAVDLTQLGVEDVLKAQGFKRSR